MSEDAGAVAVVGGLAILFFGVTRIGRRRGRAGRSRARSGKSAVPRKTWAQLEAERRVRTRSGRMVRSQGERRVADLLDELGIAYEYEPAMHGWRPDFYVPRWDLVIEYWGTDLPGTPKRAAKVATYLKHGHRLIHLERDDAPRLEEVLLRKLYRFDQTVYERARAR